MSAFPLCERFGQPATFGLYRSGSRKKPCGAATQEYRHAPAELRPSLICRVSALQSDPQRIPTRYREVRPRPASIRVPLSRGDPQRPNGLIRPHHIPATERKHCHDRVALMLVLPCCAGRCQRNLHKLDRCRTSPQPSLYGDQRPNCLKHSEGPRPLEESVDGTKDTGCRKGQDERSTAIFQRVADQHRGNCRQAKKSESIHAGYVSDRSIELERSMSGCYASRLS